MLNAGEVEIKGRVMDHARGVWPGARPQWWTATHTPTGLAVTWHEHSDQSQWKQREIAILCLEKMVSEMGCALPPPVENSEDQQ